MKGLISEMLAQRTMSMEASGVQPPGAFQMPLAPPLHVNVSGVWAKETPTVRKVAAATSHAVMGMKRSLIESLCVCIIDSLWFRGLCRHSCLCPFIVVPVNLKTQPHSFMKEFHSFAFQHPEERSVKLIARLSPHGRHLTEDRPLRSGRFSVAAAPAPQIARGADAASTSERAHGARMRLVELVLGMGFPAKGRRRPFSKSQEKVRHLMMICVAGGSGL